MPAGHALRGMISNGTPLLSLQFQAYCRVCYTKACLRFGWVEERSGEKGDEDVIYRNYATDEESKLPPIYTPSDHFYATKIQSIWAVHKAKNFIRRLLLKSTMGEIAASAILRYQPVSYIGHGLEGIQSIHIILNT
jgi:hypothetical protein